MKAPTPVERKPILAVHLAADDVIFDCVFEALEINLHFSLYRWDRYTSLKKKFNKETETSPFVGTIYEEAWDITISKQQISGNLWYESGLQSFISAFCEIVNKVIQPGNTIHLCEELNKTRVLGIKERTTIETIIVNRDSWHIVDKLPDGFSALQPCHTNGSEFETNYSTVIQFTHQVTPGSSHDTDTASSRSISDTPRSEFSRTSSDSFDVPLSPPKRKPSHGEDSDAVLISPTRRRLSLFSKSKETSPRAGSKVSPRGIFSKRGSRLNRSPSITSKEKPSNRFSRSKSCGGIFQSDAVIEKGAGSPPKSQIPPLDLQIKDVHLVHKKIREWCTEHQYPCFWNIDGIRFLLNDAVVMIDKLAINSDHEEPDVIKPLLDFLHQLPYVKVLEQEQLPVFTKGPNV